MTKDIVPSSKNTSSSSGRRDQGIPSDVTMADLYVQTVRNNEMVKTVKQALHHGKSLRGKSAKAIEFELKAESMRNLSTTTELADIRKYQRETLQTLWDERDHERMMEDRTRAIQDEESRITAPLDDLHKELKELEIRSSTYFIDKR